MQYYTFHGNKHGGNVPCVYLWLSRKNGFIYEETCKQLIKLKPELADYDGIIHVDFEVAVINTLKVTNLFHSRFVRHITKN